MAKRLRVEGTARRAGPAAWGGRDGAPLAKAREHGGERSSLRPALARAELLDKPARARFEEEIDAALKRRPTSEAKLAGAVRAVLRSEPRAARLARRGDVRAAASRRAAARALRVRPARALRGAGPPVGRRSCDRRSPGTRQAGPRRSARRASRATPSCPRLLAKVAASRQSHLAFGAELARVARGESNGALLAQLAPMIKESHRISMCVELFVPLVRGMPVAVHVGPALSVLRGAERHLGRWLVLAEVAVKAGDIVAARRGALPRARTARPARAPRGRSSRGRSRRRDAARREAPQPPPPTTRPTLELIARLSDRPERRSRHDVPLPHGARRRRVGRPMLETSCGRCLSPTRRAIRAALYLARDHGRDDMRDALAETRRRRRSAKSCAGLAAAALVGCVACRRGASTRRGCAVGRAKLPTSCWHRACSGTSRGERSSAPRQRAGAAARAVC